MTDEVVWEPYGVDTVRALMTGFARTWWLSGGHALDMFVGRATRRHGDIDISLARDDVVALVRHLAPAFEVHVAHAGMVRPADAGPVDPPVNGVWVREAGGGPWRMQADLQLVDGTEWVYRRDVRVRRPLDEVVWHADGLPYANPAVQLLWKARDATAKDDVDFVNVVPLLAASERSWLAGAIALAHPESPWNGRLRT